MSQASRIGARGSCGEVTGVSAACGSPAARKSSERRVLPAATLRAEINGERADFGAWAAAAAWMGCAGVRGGLKEKEPANLGVPARLAQRGDRGGRL